MTRRAASSSAPRARSPTVRAWQRPRRSDFADGGTGLGGGLAQTCYGIIDGTWTPVPVETGQAEADSARLAGGLPQGPAPTLDSPFVDDR